jgi:NAD(P)-dependent dehydrogenase (short-subunit alcohol dehydrogenase family)
VTQALQDTAHDYANMFRLDGRRALVTGSSKGIGRAIAEAYAAHGAAVVISSRKIDACREVADAIGAAGGTAHAIACNMSKPDDIRALAAAAGTALGGIDILVCNAAVNPHFGPMASLTEESYDRIMDTNVKNNLLLCNLVLPGMAERGDGAVIIVSSIAGLKGNRNLGAYGLSKAADLQLARNLAVEWGRSNVRVNCIAPGLVRTDMARVLWEEPGREKAAAASYALGRIGEPIEIAGAALYLAAPAGRFMTGQVMVVDGGALVAAGEYS